MKQITVTNKVYNKFKDVCNEYNYEGSTYTTPSKLLEHFLNIVESEGCY